MSPVTQLRTIYAVLGLGALASIGGAVLTHNGFTRTILAVVAVYCVLFIAGMNYPRVKFWLRHKRGRCVYCGRDIRASMLVCSDARIANTLRTPQNHNIEAAPCHAPCRPLRGTDSSAAALRP